MADDDCLTEELVVRHGGQYDPELLQRLTLSGLRLARLGAGLARCTALRVLDLARNKLQHLDGVEVCASLERLLVARNELTRFGFVAGLAKLDHLDARANALQDVDAVAAHMWMSDPTPRLPVMVARRIAQKGGRVAILRDDEALADEADPPWLRALLRWGTCT